MTEATRAVPSRRLSFQVLGVLVAVLAVVQAGVVLHDTRAERRALFADLQRESTLMNEALEYAIEALVESGDMDGVRRVVQNLALSRDVIQLALVDAHGVSEAHGDRGQVGQRFDVSAYPGLSAALERARSHDEHVHLKIDESERALWVHAFAVTGGARTRAERSVIVVVTDLARVNARIEASFWEMVALNCVITLLATVLVWLLLRRLALRPLAHLSVALQAARESGRFAIGSTPRNEIGELGRSIDNVFQELTESRDELRRLAAVAERTDNAVVITDRHGVIQWVNFGFTRMTGYEASDAVGRTPGSFLQGPDTDRDTVERMRDAMRSGYAFREEVLNYRKSGEAYWLSIDAQPIRDEGGEIEMFVAIENDITNRRRTQQALQDSESRFRSLVHNIPGATYRCQFDADWTMLFVSPNIASITGYSPSDFIDNKVRSFASVIHGEDRDWVADAVRVAIEHRSAWEIEYRLIRRDQQVCWVYEKGEAVFDVAGEPTCLDGFILDITARRAAEEALQLNEARLDLALSAAREGLWDWNVVTNEVFFNDSWYTMLGYEPLEYPMELATWERLTHPEDLSRAYREVERHLEGETEQYRCEHRLRTKSGEWRWILDIGEVIERTPDGKPLRLIGVHVDIDDQKRSQEELEAARQEAEAASRSKGEFLANMSHEIRTPMTAILGFTDMLLDLRGSDDQFEVAVSTIRRNGQHLLTIINDILDLSKIESGKMAVERIPTSPVDVIEDVVSLMSVRADAKAIELGVHVGYPVPASIESDPIRFRQILVNLIGNAIKFTDEGRVDVFLHQERLEDGTGRLRIEVRDTGIGMTPEQVDRLFRPFSQADSSTARRYGGTGLGLTISRRLAELLHGGIFLRSETGRGSVFTIELPAGKLSDQELLLEAPQRSVAEPESSLVPVASLGESDEPKAPLGRVLLAEDGPDNQMLVSLLLTRVGLRVDVAENGLVACEQVAEAEARGESFDVILMDMQMPEMDGYEATRTLRQRGYDGWILALTANAMKSDEERCLAAGCDSYATKPIDRAALYEKIFHCIECPRVPKPQLS